MEASEAVDLSNKYEEYDHSGIFDKIKRSASAGKRKLFIYERLNEVLRLKLREFKYELHEGHDPRSGDFTTTISW